MQVQHETQLIEGQGPLRAQDFAPKPNQTLESYTLTQTSLGAVERLISCPVSNLIAAFITSTNQIIVIDTKSRLKRERFPLKSCDKKFSRQSFTLKGIDFSPDGTRLAIGQTDCIIYIYKLSSTSSSSSGGSATLPAAAASNAAAAAAATGHPSATNVVVDQNPLKPTITGKFICSSPVTCLIWTELGILFGIQDGKVKLISMTIKPTATTSDGQSSGASTTSAKVNPIYSPPSNNKGSVPISLAFKSPVIAIGLMDGNVLLLTTTTTNTTQSDNSTTSTNSQIVVGGNEAALGPSSLTGQLADHPAQSRRNSSLPSTSTSTSTAATIYNTITHTCPPYYLAFLQTNVICCAGSDGKIAFHSLDGSNNIATISNHHHHHHHHNKSDSSLTANNNNKAPLEGGSLMQTIELKEDLIALDYSPINEVLALVTSSKLYFIKFNQELRAWQLQASYIELANLSLPLTSVQWTREGSQLAVGSLSGSLELFRCQWSKQTVGDQLDICHIAKNRVRITDRARNLLATYRTQHDIKKVNLLDNGQSVIIWTTNSLLLARLSSTTTTVNNNNSSLQQQQQQSSEIPWSRSDRSVKFCFDHPGFVLIFKGSLASSSEGQLMVVKLGQDKIIYSVKMESIRKSIISVRQYPPSVVSANNQRLISSAGLDDGKQRSSPGSAKSRHSSIASVGDNNLAAGQDNNNNSLQTTDSLLISPPENLIERLAYLIERNQLVVVNLTMNNTRELVKVHEKSIVWLEFNHTSNCLVFRDILNRLYLINLDIQQQQQTEDQSHSRLLAENCEFANWLPESDILIAQSLHNISIWYNIKELNKVTILDSRSYNINRAPPIIDLSFAKSHNRKPYLTIKKIGPENHQLLLSNGQIVSLDRVKVKFYTELVGRRLISALEVLEKEASAKVSGGSGEGAGYSNLELWSRLGWLAVERFELQVAIKAFGWLGHTSMVKYLEICLAKPEELQWRLALIRGDWELFEQVADQQQIVSTYKRLNRWTLLIDYLNRTQQFRQRDLAELDYRQWLLDKGRYLEGAKIQAKNGDLLGAVELLMTNKRYCEAADLFIAEEKVSLARAHDRSTKMDANLMDLARRLCSNLMELQEFHRSALLCDKILAQPNEALDLYLRGGSYERAIELAKLVAPDRVSQIETAFADHLVEQFKANKRSRRQTFEAIDRYLAAGKLLKALDTSIELKNFNRGYEIFQMLREKLEAEKLEEEEDDEALMRQSLRVNSKAIAEHLFRKTNDDNSDRSKAIEVLLAGEHYNQVMDFYIEQGEFKEAFGVSLIYLNGKDREKTVDQFAKLAKQMLESGNIDGAERIYLMLDRPEMAIEMHKRFKNYDRMLELVGEFSPDSLEPTLLLLARELESESRYLEAEQYLLRASQAEWTNVVRMYQLAGKWDEAYRVARDNCASVRDPLLIQLAYRWAKSLAIANNGKPELAYDLLKRKLNILNQVLEFCCENKNFQFAIDLCQCDNSSSASSESQNSQKSRVLNDMVRRYASYLEEQHKFLKAEEVLLKFNLVEEAAKMYLDNDQHLEAIRVVESQLGSHNSNENSNDNDNNYSSSSSNNKSNATIEHEEHEQLVELLNRILVLCADRLVNNLTIKQQLISGQVSGEVGERLLAAQQMYLRAQRPELAVNLYKERGLWKEAIQVAQRFAPQLLESLESALDAEVARDVGPIVAQVDADRRRNELAASKNHSPLMGGESSGQELSRKNYNNFNGAAEGVGSKSKVMNKQQQYSNNNNINSSGSGPDYLKLQAETSMLNGDANGTKTALGKFLDSLIDGGH